MSQIDKLIAKFYEKPVRNDITHGELEKIATYYGCVIMARGKHQKAIVDVKSGTVIPIPCHGKSVKEAYIIQAKELFEKIKNRTD